MSGGDEKSLAVIVVEPSGLISPTASSLVVPSMDPATVFLSRFVGAQSRRVMTSSLCVLGSLLKGVKVTDPRTVSWAAVRYPHAQRLRGLLAVQYAPATANRHLSALRGVIGECWQLGLMDHEAAAQVQAVKTVKGNKRDAGRALSVAEVSALYATCDATLIGRRNAAVIALAVHGGLRRSEVCGLDIEHWNGTTGAVEVLGKGNKWRTVYLVKTGREAVESWLLLRGKKPGPLVLPASKHGALVVEKRLTDDGVYSLLQRLGMTAKVADFSPHDLRRTYITRLLEKGADALTVSKLAGHADVQTTMGYDKRGEAAKRAAVALLDFD